MLGFYPDSITEKTASSPDIKLEAVINAVALRGELDKAAALFPVTIEPTCDDYMTSAQKAKYAGILSQVLGMIDSMSFGIIRRWQQEQSYSCYVVFAPSDWNNQPVDKLVEVKFRVSEHEPNGGEHYSHNENDMSLFVNFEFDGKTFDDIDDLIGAIRSKMEDIKSGIF